MEKLIELLNEYEDNANNHYRYYWGLDGSYISSNVSGTDHDLDKDEASIIIKSKEYGFIERLVENDKIEFSKVKEKKYGRELTYDFFKENPKKSIDVQEERLLMLLAIQDSPIDFLISILKNKKVRTVYVDKDGNVSGDTKQYSNC